MPISCGIQCMTCDYPIHMDTYKGCSHACKYCFVKAKYAIHNVEPIHTTQSLRNFINGGRNYETRWCDWDIPIHWGGNSDPFQPAELEHHCSLECLEIFADTGYPFIVSTKNPVMLTQEPYLSLISKCRCVLQISMACSKYDRLEQGAPTFTERLKAADFLHDKVTRIIARVRPYFPDCHEDIVKAIPEYAKAGIYGISISSYITKKKTQGMKRYGNTYMFDCDFLEPLLREIKQVCHDNGLKFFCCEDGFEHWSDSLTCCGTMGLEDFKPNTYNISHMSYDDEQPEPTEAMKAINTYQPFKCIGQSQTWAMHCKTMTFMELVLEQAEQRIPYNRQCVERYRDE